MDSATSAKGKHLFEKRFRKGVFLLKYAAKSATL